MMGAIPRGTRLALLSASLPMETPAPDLARLRENLDTWGERVARLKGLPAHRTERGRARCGQYVQGVVDRYEGARNKLERLARADGSRREEAAAELERALEGLKTAWDAAVARIPWKDPASPRGARG
jgi:hypothetical protein